jgi:hypothetical protein
MRIWRFLVAVALGLSAGCTAIPLATMWKMRDMTPERFFAMDPQKLRAAIRVAADQPMKGQPTLRADIEANATRPICYVFTLDPVDPRASGEPRLEPAPANRRWHAFRLSQAGLDAFARARREVRVKQVKESGTSMSLSVSWDFADAAAVTPPEGVPFRVDLATDRDEAYFTLIKETFLKVGATKPADDSKSAAPKPAEADDPCAAA